MQNLFRLIGQQMGMQQIRVILPEEIYKLLDKAVMDIIREVLASNATVDFGNKVAIQKNELSPINALRNLYKEASVSISNDVIPSTGIQDNVLFYIGAAITNKNNHLRRCRIIDPLELENVLADYCNSPSVDYPICYFVNDGFTVYPKGCGSTATLKYIVAPELTSVNENKEYESLPLHLHREIVQRAVTTYFTSVGYTTPTNSQNS